MRSLRSTNSAAPRFTKIPIIGGRPAYQHRHFTHTQSPGPTPTRSGRTSRLYTVATVTDDATWWRAPESTRPAKPAALSVKTRLLWLWRRPDSTAVTLQTARAAAAPRWVIGTLRQMTPPALTSAVTSLNSQLRIHSMTENTTRPSTSSQKTRGDGSSEHSTDTSLDAHSADMP